MTEEIKIGKLIFKPSAFYEQADKEFQKDILDMIRRNHDKIVKAFEVIYELRAYIERFVKGELPFEITLMVSFTIGDIMSISPSGNLTKVPIIFELRDGGAVIMLEETNIEPNMVTTYQYTEIGEIVYSS